jgi:hypothetical protein
MLSVWGERKWDRNILSLTDDVTTVTNTNDYEPTVNALVTRQWR